VSFLNRLPVSGEIRDVPTRSRSAVVGRKSFYPNSIEKCPRGEVDAGASPTSGAENLRPSAAQIYLLPPMFRDLAEAHGEDHAQRIQAPKGRQKMSIDAMSSPTGVSPCRFTFVLGRLIATEKLRMSGFLPPSVDIGSMPRQLATLTPPYSTGDRTVLGGAFAVLDDLARADEGFGRTAMARERAGRKATNVTQVMAP
jgi:hypothetical protein